MNGTHAGVPEPLEARFCATLDSMTKSMADTRNTIKSLLEKLVSSSIIIKTNESSAEMERMRWISKMAFRYYR